MAAHGSLSVAIACVIVMGLPQGALHGFGRLGHCQQVDMIAHQAPGPDVQLKFVRIRPKQFQVDPAISGVVEHDLTRVAALRDVVRHTRRNYSSDSSHAGSVPAGERKSREK